MITDGIIKGELYALRQNLPLPPTGMSSFVHAYVHTYVKLLPTGVLFDDVRENVRATYERLAFLQGYDGSLPFASLYVVMRDMLIPKLDFLKKDPVSILSDFGFRGSLRFLNATNTRQDFAPVRSRLTELEDDSHSERMEQIFQNTSTGVQNLSVHLIEKFIVTTRVLRVLFQCVFDESNPAMVGVLFGMLNANYFTNVDGDQTLVKLHKEIFRG